MALFQILPQLSAEDHDRLAVSIKERGVEVPVIKDENGEIIDGHNRAMIADSLGIDYPTEVRTGMSDAQKRLLAVDLNLARRQLTDAQKVMLGKAIEPDIAEESKKREIAGKAVDPMDKCPQGATRDAVAKKVGIGSGRTYERAKQVLEAIEAQPDGAQLIEHVKDGSLDLKEAKKELEHRGVEWQKPANLVALPRPGDRATPEMLDGVAQVFYEAQLPHMVAGAILEAQQHITKGSQKAQAALKKIRWDDVTDEMLSDKSIVDAVHYTDAELARFFTAFQNARRTQVGLRSVK